MAGETILIVEDEHPTVRLWVKDNGPGIDPANQPRLFERFYRGQNAQPIQIKQSDFRHLTR